MMPFPGRLFVKGHGSPFLSKARWVYQPLGVAGLLQGRVCSVDMGGLSTETCPDAGSFLRTEGFLNQVLLNSQMSFACVPDCVFLASEAPHRFLSDTLA